MEMRVSRSQVIDLRTLQPWDVAAVEESVNKTGRLIVSHEAPVTSEERLSFLSVWQYKALVSLSLSLAGGFGAEVIATISRRCFLRLESPPLRVCGMDTPFPLVYEEMYLPSVQRCLAAIKKSVKF